MNPKQKDFLWNQIAAKRDTTDATFVSHEEAWQDNHENEKEQP